MRCPNPPLATPVCCIVSMPMIVRILTAGTDDKSCRIAIVRGNDIYEMSPFLKYLANMCFCRAVPNQQPRLTSTANRCQRIAYGIIKCSISSSSSSSSRTQLRSRTTLHQPQAASTRRSCYCPSFSAVQRHGGPPRFQLTMHQMEKIQLGYTDSPKALKSTAKWSLCSCQTSLGTAVTANSKPTCLALAAPAPLSIRSDNR